MELGQLLLSNANHEKYEADLDLKTEQKVLYTMKQKLAKNRLLLQKRKKFLQIIKNKESKINNKSIKEIEIELANKAHSPSLVRPP